MSSIHSDQGIISSIIFKKLSRFVMCLRLAYSRSLKLRCPGMVDLQRVFSILSYGPRGRFFLNKINSDLISTSLVSGKARFDALPDTVTYRYDTGKVAHPMEVRLTTEPVSPDVPVPPGGPGVPGTPPSGPGVPSTPPSGPDVPSTPPSDPDVPPVTSPVSPEPNSGGGCTAGLGSAVLLALVPLALRRRW